MNLELYKKIINDFNNSNFKESYNLAIKLNKNQYDEKILKILTISSFKIQNYIDAIKYGLKLYTSKKIDVLNEDTNKLIKSHPPDIILIYSKRSAESFIELMKKYSLNGLMTGSRVMCISEKVLSVFKKAGWKKIETFEAGDELTKIGN